MSEYRVYNMCESCREYNEFRCIILTPKLFVCRSVLLPTNANISHGMTHRGLQIKPRDHLTIIITITTTAMDTAIITIREVIIPTVIIIVMAVKEIMKEEAEAEVEEVAEDRVSSAVRRAIGAPPVLEGIVLVVSTVLVAGVEEDEEEVEEEVMAAPTITAITAVIILATTMETEITIAASHLMARSSHMGAGVGVAVGVRKQGRAISAGRKVTGVPIALTPRNISQPASII